MTSPLDREIRAILPTLSRSERAVAHAMLADLSRLAFHTAASIADLADVSPMTVSRFLRRMGYNGLPELRDRIRKDHEASPLLISERMERLAPDQGHDRLNENFSLETRCILSAYELRGTAAWAAAVAALDGADRVFVTGFQIVSGLASDFAARLDYMREGVTVLDGSNGTFSELFMGAPEASCLILFEMRRYTAVSRLLAQEAAARGVRVVIICDMHCYWAHDYSQMVLPVQTESRLFWDNTSAFSTVCALLCEELATRRGESVKARTAEMRQLQDGFGVFRD